MRNIPSELLQKINKKYQTKYNEADPKIHLVFHRSERYIEQGGLIVPWTVFEDPPAENPGSWDTALKREIDRYKTFPSHVYRVDTEGTTAKVTRAPYDTVFATTEVIDFEWEDLEWEIADAIEVAIEFNGYWVRTAKDADLCFDSPAAWTHVTEGEPYVFWVDSAGALHVQQRGEAAVELAASGVTKIAAIRGWKNVYRWNMDHGLIIAYVKNDAVYYRTWANQGTEEDPLPPAWESEREVTDLPTPAQDVEAFRTNDYRTGFLCEHNGEIHWAITERNWAGMAIADHYITAQGIELFTDFIAIIYEDVLHAHTIEAQGTEVAAMLCPPIWPSVDTIYNPEDEEGDPIVQEIYIELTLDVYGDGTGLEDAFTVTDETDPPTNYNVLSTVRDSTDNKVLKLSTEDFEGAAGDLTVDYDFSTAPIYSQVEGGCLMELDSFNIAFTPTLEPPEGFTGESITITGTELTADFIAIDYVDAGSEEIDTISVEGTEVFVDFIHTDEIVT